jgi:hypothetical protein
LQAVLTAYYEDIKGVQGASGYPKTKIVKRRFEDQEDAGTTPKDEAGIEDAGGAAAAPAAGAAAAAPPAGAAVAAPPPAGRILHLRLLLLNQPLAQLERRGAMW